MQKVQKRVIGGVHYEITQLKTSAGFKMFRQVGTVVGPGFGGLASSGGSLLEMDIASEGFIKAVGLLLENYDSPVVDEIVRKMAEVTRVDPNGGDQFVPLPGVYEVHFQGKMKALHQWLLFGLQVQFADFLESPAADATE